MKHSLILCAIIMAGLCLGQTYTLEIHAQIDGEPGYCDSLLSLAGASPGAGIHDIPAGDSVTMTIDTTLVEVAIGTRDSCYGWTSIASTLDSTYGHGTSLSFEMTENTSVVWNFKRQFTFEVTCSHDYDSPNPPYGVHWFDGGDSITASIDMIVGDTVCLGYIGTGSVDTGPSNSWTGIINEPSTLNWFVDVAEPPCSLVVISEHGFSISPSGTTVTYWMCGVTVIASNQAVDSSDIALGIIYTCIGWRGEGCVLDSGPVPYVPPYNICTVVCSTAGTLEWLWDTFYTGIEENLPSAKPGDFEISTYPNPFNSSVRISLDYGSESPQGLSTSPPARVEIYDVAGRKVKSVTELVEVPDGFEVPNDAIAKLPSTGSGSVYVWQPAPSLPSGVYLVRARFGPSTLRQAQGTAGSGTVVTKRVVYLK